MPYGERIALQSWGCFIIAVALIVHQAMSFSAEAQRSVGKAFVVCFGILTVLYSHALVFVAMPSVAFWRGVAAAGFCFISLFVAYAWALVATPPKRD